MRGKEALKSANRRVADASASADQLRDRLQRQESSYQRRIVELESEVRRLHTEHRAEAARIAAEEVTRRLAQAADERRKRGLSDDIAIDLMLKKDEFIRNACRYLSMTLGRPPRSVLPMVMAWATNEDFYGFTSVDMLVKLGVDADGWLARNIRANKHWERRWRIANRRQGKPEAYSLDYAEDNPSNFEIHPNYDPTWYPRIEYGGIELVDDPADADPEYWASGPDEMPDEDEVTPP